MSAQQEAREALDQLRGLRKLKERGMHVHRTENMILNRLTDEALAIVAGELEKESK